MKRTKCEVYSRVVGYLSPVSEWNKGKREEFKQRKTYDINLNGEETNAKNREKSNKEE